MGKEIDLLENYPHTKRNVEERGATKLKMSGALRGSLVRIFDGDRQYGYGGFQYFPRFWQPVTPTFQKHFNNRQ